MAASRRRMWIATIFGLVILAAIVGAVVVLVTSGGEEQKKETAGGETPVPTEPSAVPSTPSTPSTPATPEPTSPLVMEFPPTPTPYAVSTPAGMRYLLIPRLADQFEVPIPIVDVPIVDRQWDVSGLGMYVGWLQGTTWMDPAWGNTVLAAHVQLGTNNPGPFWGLSTLVAGDEIIVIEGGLQHRFVVTDTKAVDPNDWTVTAPTDGPMLTLITCTNWDNNFGVFSQRLVVQAVPAETGEQSG